MYVMCFLLVVLNIDIICTWIIPAGVRSPSTSPILYEHGAYCVVLDGDLSISYDNVDGSYGRIQSPDTGASDWAWCVYPDGNVVGNYITAVDNSYGNLLRQSYIM